MAAKTNSKDSESSSLNSSSQKETIQEKPIKDIAETVIDDGYLDILEDKKVPIYFVGMNKSLKRNFGKEDIDATTLLSTIPKISDICDIEVHNFMDVPSTSITPEMMLELSKKVQKSLDRPEVCGAVVVHGSDTLEETAYFLGISLSEDFQTRFFKPIVFTTASCSGMTVSDNLPQNLLASIRIACNEFKEIAPQVLVCVDSEIHGAKKVQKVQTFGDHSFMSPGWGPVGYVDPDAVYIRSGSVNEDLGLNFPTPEKLSAEVALVKAMTGDKGEAIDLMVEKGVDGIVVEGFGRGNVPATMMDSIRKAIEKGVIVVAGTRCNHGRVLDDDEDFNGSVSDLIQAGALTAGETGTAKARLLLIYTLSQPDAIQLRRGNPQLFLAFLQECLDPVLAERLFEP